MVTLAIGNVQKLYQLSFWPTECSSPLYFSNAQWSGIGRRLILRRSSSFEDFVKTFTDAILPASIAFREITQGSVFFTVQAFN